MTDIVIATFNAKYIHPAFGLRCILANLGPLKECATLVEFDLREPPGRAAERILAAKPRVVGIGTYIWNLLLVRQLVVAIRAADPSVCIVLGGPEAGYATDDEPAVVAADYVIAGEGEDAFRELCEVLLSTSAQGPTSASVLGTERVSVPSSGIVTDSAPSIFSLRGAERMNVPVSGVRHTTVTDGTVSGSAPGRSDSDCSFVKRIDAAPPDLANLTFPYDLYTDDDIAHRLIYVEATRGCPFRCEYCLSSRDRGVRRFPMPYFLAAMDRLLARGARRFKFVDRSFNSNGRISLDILDFFLDRIRPGLLLHFELVPDCLPPDFIERFRRFPPGVLHFEVGIQSFSPTVNRRIGRVQNNRMAESCLRRLRRETVALIHADLIVGLPGEDMESFGKGFDRLLRLQPHEIQVNPLKRLHGTTIDRHSKRWGMVFSPNPPYEVLETRSIPRGDMERLHRFARYFGMFHNSGNFARSLPRLLARGKSQFAIFMQFSDWLFARFGRAHAIPLNELATALFIRLRSIGDDPAEAETAIRADYHHRARRERLKLEV
jgi:radical SAM superfamily enzyme YgiQ (UPF0313 family)